MKLNPKKCHAWYVIKLGPILFFSLFILLKEFVETSFKIGKMKIAIFLLFALVVAFANLDTTSAQGEGTEAPATEKSPSGTKKPGGFMNKIKNGLKKAAEGIKEGFKEGAAGIQKGAEKLKKKVKGWINGKKNGTTTSSSQVSGP
ncbi:hypothetical protein Fcan01_24629 [Folsomia candida]|uniref:Uncharacterized protein n=1 Tax=Folsomia candida TaxID=158441 RepID=A0A226D6L2_FOLCA|nr:hypothetical protein Fcan01_24629 [Folsomia candida]